MVDLGRRSVLEMAEVPTHRSRHGGRTKSSSCYSNEHRACRWSICNENALQCHRLTRCSAKEGQGPQGPQQQEHRFFLSFSGCQNCQMTSPKKNQEMAAVWIDWVQRHPRALHDLASSVQMMSYMARTPRQEILAEGGEMAHFFHFRLILG